MTFDKIYLAQAYINGLNANLNQHLNWKGDTRIKPFFNYEANSQEVNRIEHIISMMQDTTK